MKPTEEQQAILNATDRTIRINARAGTGKTTTLQMIAEKHLKRRILYLVFNRRAMEEAREKFPANVRVSTVHGLAFQKEGRKWKDTLGNFSPADMLPAFGQRKQVLATISHAFLTFFLNSAADRLEDALTLFPEYLPKSSLGLFNKNEGTIVKACRKISTEWYRQARPCPHDFYLKLFHKSGDFHKELGRYDMVFFDEGQDLSGIMIDAVKKCNKPTVLVGDTHQQIYGFRYAIDAMKKLQFDRSLDLTLSFRFGKPIADVSTVFIQEAKKAQEFVVRGNPHKSSKVSFYSNVSHVPDGSAILTRTNFSLFARAMELRSKRKSFRFERDIDSLLWRTLDIYRLSRDKKEEIRDPFIDSFKSLKQLKEYAEIMEDYQLMGMSQIVEKYADAFPAVIYEMSKLAKERSGNNNRGEIILSTVHSAKGQEYKSVYIDPDIAFSIAKPKEKENWQYGEDINVAYVAFTRAIKNLRLPESFLTILTPKWQATVKRYQKQHVKSSPPKSTTAKGVPYAGHRYPGQGGYGSRVYHETYGHGVVKGTMGEIWTVAFDQGETKKIQKNFVKIDRR